MITELEEFRRRVMPEERHNSDITIGFDVDGVICHNNHGDYKNAAPYLETIKRINDLYDKGYHIILHTARYGQRFPGQQYQVGYEEAVTWFRKHGLKYHEFYMGKPHYDIMADDKGHRLDPESSESWDEFERLVSELGKKNKYGELLTV